MSDTRAVQSAPTVTLGSSKATSVDQVGVRGAVGERGGTKIISVVVRPRAKRRTASARQPSSKMRGRQQPHLPPGISEAIRDSRSILDMKDNWDEEGSPGYTEATWNRAVQFIRENVRRLRQFNGVRIAPPRILPGPDGSIDIHWKLPKRELLINIPLDPEEPASYYGDAGAKDLIKGRLDTSSRNEWILMWLMR